MQCPCAGDYVSEDALQHCTAYVKAARCLLKYFQFSEFRAGQLEAILAALHGRNAFVRFPTGGEKSLCMFLVPLIYGKDSMGIIISPLNGLMDEQVYTCAP